MLEKNKSEVEGIGNTVIQDSQITVNQTINQSQSDISQYLNTNTVFNEQIQGLLSFWSKSISNLSEKDAADWYDTKVKLENLIFRNSNELFVAKHKKELAGIVFDRIINVCFDDTQQYGKIEQQDIDTIQKIRNNKEEHDVKDRSLLVSGLTISLLNGNNRFEEKTIHSLIDLLIDFITGFEEEVWQKALVGLTFALIHYNTRLNLPKEILKRFDKLKEITDIQYGIYLIDSAIRRQAYSLKELYKKDRSSLFSQMKILLGDSIILTRDDVQEIYDIPKSMSEFPNSPENKIISKLFSKEKLDKLVFELEEKLKETESITMTIEDFFNFIDFEIYVELYELNPFLINSSDLYDKPRNWFIPFKGDENIRNILVNDFQNEDIDINKLITIFQNLPISDIEKHYFITHIKEFSKDALDIFICLDILLKGKIMSTKLELILTLTIRDLYRFDKLNILSKSKDLITNSINIYNKSLLEKITDYVNQQKIEANHLCDDKKFDESLKILLNIPKSKYDLDIYSLFINNYIALDKDEQAIPYLNELITLFENGHISITADEKIDWYGKSKRLYKRLCKTENEQYVSNYHLYAKKEIDIRKKTLNLNDNDLLRVEQEHLLSDCYNEYAWFLREQKQYVDAIKYCDKARKLNPEDDDTWNLKGLCFLELNEDKKALKSFNQAIKLNNKDASIWSNKGFALFRLKNYTEALKCNNEAIKLSPNNDAFLQGKKIIKKALEDENIDKVRTLINEQQYEDALDLINFVLKSNPQSEITWNIKGNCLLNLNMPDDEIMKCFDKAIELNNDYSIAYHNKGFLLDRQQNYKEALAYYDKAIELSPNYEIAITNREDLLQKLSDISIDTIIDLIDQQDYENALSDIDNYLILNSSNETIWNLKANCFLYLYDYEEAVVCYNNFIELNDKDELIWNNRGICLTDLEHYDEAINSFNKSIELNPNNEYVWFNKGYALFYSNNENEAIICFEKAIDLNSENEWSWSYKGNCLQNLEKYEESLIYYNKSIELYSGDESVWSNKGLSLLYLERYEEAIICCDKSIELNSENEIAWYWKGCCLSDMQQYEEAIACYDEAIRINPDNEHYLLQKEKCLFNMNNNIK